MANLTGPSFYDNHQQYSGRSPELADYDRIALYLNPKATNAHLNDYLEQSLRDSRDDHGLHVVRYDTCADAAGNRELLAATLEETDIAGIAGGDGTKSQMFNAAILANIGNPFLPIATGNSTNLGNMFHGRAARNPLAVLAKGRLSAIHPYHVTAEHADFGQQSEYSFAYWDIGAIALAAEPFCDTTVRERLGKLGRVTRFIEETKLVKASLAAAQQAPPMEVKLRIDDGPAATLALREFGLVFGSEMAKAIRFRQNRFDNQAIMLQLSSVSLPRVMIEAARQALGISVRLAGTERLHFSVETLDGQPFAKQNDGEAYIDKRLPSGTSFTAKHAEQSVSVLAVKAPARQKSKHPK